MVEVAKKIATVVEKQAEIDPERLATAIQVAILKAWDRQVRNFLVELYEKVKLWRTEKPTYYEYQQVLQMLKDYFGGEGLVSLIRRPVIQLALFGYRKGKSETLEEVQGPGVDISLNQTDRYALRVLEKYTTFWLKKREDEFVDKVMAEELRKYYELGLTWDELAQNLENRLKDKWRHNRKAYFKTVARHWANQTRQLGRVSGYEEAGIKYVRVVAVLDSHTTQICRTMHGRIIPVKDLVKQRDAVLDVMNRKGGVKALQQVHRLWTEKEFEAYLRRKRNLSTDSLVKDGIVMPPYHFNCRTRTVAYQGPVELLDYCKSTRTWWFIQKKRLCPILDRSEKYYGEKLRENDFLRRMIDGRSDFEIASAILEFQRKASLNLPEGKYLELSERAWDRKSRKRLREWFGGFRDETEGRMLLRKVAYDVITKPEVILLQMRKTRPKEGLNLPPWEEQFAFVRKHPEIGKDLIAIVDWRTGRIRDVFELKIDKWPDRLAYSRILYSIRDDLMPKSALK